MLRPSPLMVTERPLNHLYELNHSVAVIERPLNYLYELNYSVAVIERLLNYLYELNYSVAVIERLLNYLYEPNLPPAVIEHLIKNNETIICDQLWPAIEWSTLRKKLPKLFHIDLYAYKARHNSLLKNI